MVVLKFSKFLAPYAMPETVIVETPIAMHGRNPIETNLHTAVKIATSIVPAVSIIR